MPGAALQGDEALVDERLGAVDQPGDLGTVLGGTAGHRGDVGLVGLADVGGVGAGDGAVLAHPGDGDRRVEAAGERETDQFADGQI